MGGVGGQLVIAGEREFEEQTGLVVDTPTGHIVRRGAGVNSKPRSMLLTSISTES